VAVSAVLSERRVSDRVLDLTVDSAALGRPAQVRLLLPAGHPGTPGRRWPVLYLLHGCCDDYQSWTRGTDVEALTAGSEVLVVTPEAGRAGFYSNWWNHGRYGPPAWETFHLDEVTPLLEREYRASGNRVVAGLSMGGFGAMSYAARRPGMFAAAASFSGPLHTMYLSPEGFTGPDGIAMVLVQEGEEQWGPWGTPEAQPGIWAAHNPYDLVERLRGIPLYVCAGDGTAGPFDPPGTDIDLGEAFLCRESAEFAGRAAALGLDITTDFYGPGTHNWPYWQRALHRAYPMLMAALGAG
jgi:S-formylglutathione hydrolase FrmB